MAKRQDGIISPFPGRSRPSRAIEVPVLVRERVKPVPASVTVPVQTVRSGYPESHTPQPPQAEAVHVRTLEDLSRGLPERQRDGPSPLQAVRELRQVLSGSGRPGLSHRNSIGEGGRTARDTPLREKPKPARVPIGKLGPKPLPGRESKEKVKSREDLGHSLPQASHSMPLLTPLLPQPLEASLLQPDQHVEPLPPQPVQFSLLLSAEPSQLPDDFVPETAQPSLPHTLEPSPQTAPWLPQTLQPWLAPVQPGQPVLPQPPLAGHPAHPAQETVPVLPEPLPLMQLLPSTPLYQPFQLGQTLLPQSQVAETEAERSGVPEADTAAAAAARLRVALEAAAPVAEGLLVVVETAAATAADVGGRLFAWGASLQHQQGLHGLEEASQMHGRGEHVEAGETSQPEQHWWPAQPVQSSQLEQPEQSEQPEELEQPAPSVLLLHEHRPLTQAMVPVPKLNMEQLAPQGEKEGSWLSEVQTFKEGMPIMISPRPEQIGQWLGTALEGPLTSAEEPCSLKTCEQPGLLDGPPQSVQAAGPSSECVSTELRDSETEEETFPALADHERRDSLSFLTKFQMPSEERWPELKRVCTELLNPAAEQRADSEGKAVRGPADLTKIPKELLNEVQLRSAAELEITAAAASQHLEQLRRHAKQAVEELVEVRAACLAAEAELISEQSSKAAAESVLLHLRAHGARQALQAIERQEGALVALEPMLLEFEAARAQSALELEEAKAHRAIAEAALSEVRHARLAAEENLEAERLEAAAAVEVLAHLQERHAQAVAGLEVQEQVQAKLNNLVADARASRETLEEQLAEERKQVAEQHASLAEARTQRLAVEASIEEQRQLTATLERSMEALRSRLQREEEALLMDRREAAEVTLQTGERSEGRTALERRVEQERRSVIAAVELLEHLVAERIQAEASLEEERAALNQICDEAVQASQAKALAAADLDRERRLAVQLQSELEELQRQGPIRIQQLEAERNALREAERGLEGLRLARQAASERRDRELREAQAAATLLEQLRQDRQEILGCVAVARQEVDVAEQQLEALRRRCVVLPVADRMQDLEVPVQDLSEVARMRREVEAAAWLLDDLNARKATADAQAAALKLAVAAEESCNTAGDEVGKFGLAETTVVEPEPWEQSSALEHEQHQLEPPGVFQDQRQPELQDTGSAEHRPLQPVGDALMAADVQCLVVPTLNQGAALLQNCSARVPPQPKRAVQLESQTAGKRDNDADDDDDFPFPMS